MAQRLGPIFLPRQYRITTHIVCAETGVLRPQRTRAVLPFGYHRIVFPNSVAPAGHATAEMPVMRWAERGISKEINVTGHVGVLKGRAGRSTRNCREGLLKRCQAHHGAHVKQQLVRQ